MVPFLYPRKGKKHPLPHSQAFSHLPKHKRHHSHPSERNTQETEEAFTRPGAAQDLDTYTASLYRWTLCQLRTSFPTVPHRLSRHRSSYTTLSRTPTIVSPLYPTDSSLYNCSIVTPRLGSDGDAEQLMGDVGETPCNTPKTKGLRRRSTVVAAKGGSRVKDECSDEGEGQARLRPVELVRSLSCAG